MEEERTLGRCHGGREDTDLHGMVMEIRYYNLILVVHSYKMGS